MNIDKFLTYINDALDELYINDQYLIKNETHEMSIVSKFTTYLTIVLLNNNFNNGDYNIDNEYDKDRLSESGLKEIIYNNKIINIRPDLIIHTRGNNDNNLVAIEFKKESNKNNKAKWFDNEKLKILTDNNYRYKYQYGFYIEFTIKRENVIVKIYKDGNEI